MDSYRCVLFLYRKFLHICDTSMQATDNQYIFFRGGEVMLDF